LNAILAVAVAGVPHLILRKINFSEAWKKRKEEEGEE
jgi:preprotein translocase subunit SecB